jgi:hypothetical protein
VKLSFTRTEMGRIENSAYQAGVAVGETMERARVVALLENAWGQVCSPVMEPDECSVCWLTENVIKAIKGGKL